MKYNIKIGARILSKDVLKKLLPSYDNIFNQIESIRAMACEVNQKEDNHNINTSSYNNYKEFNEQFNNVFSILGRRGSGKTSALLTIKRNIMKKNQQDIILPLIIPENMGENSDVLGWLFAQFKKEINNLEDKLNKDCFKNKDECRFNGKICLNKKFNELIKHYRFINNDYRKIILNQFDTLNSYIESSKNILAPEYELVVKFEEFIDEMLNAKKELNKDKQEPLIFIFFDDVDLSNHRCMEVLDVILRYLSNSNIIVFVSGDYDTFSEIITINNLRKDKLLKIDLDTTFYKEKTCLEVRKELTQDILKKVIPPALRYYMPVLNNKSKAEFIYSTGNTKQNYEQLNKLIYNKLIKISNKEIEENESFLYYNKQLILDYFLIFDENARGVMNVYYFLYNLNFSECISKDEDENQNRKDGKKKEYEEKEFCNVLKEFLKVIIESSSVFSTYRVEIEKIIDLKENLKYTFIDYNHISNLMKSNIISTSEDILKIFILANFMEQLICLKYNKLYYDTRKIHGGKMLNYILDNELYPNNGNIQLNLLLHSLLSSVLPKNIKLSINDESEYFTNIYFQQLKILVENNQKVNGKYSYFFQAISRKDPIWVRRIIRKIMSETGERSAILENTIRKAESEYKVIYSYCNIKDTLYSCEYREKLKNEISNKLSNIEPICKSRKFQLSIKVPSKYPKLNNIIDELNFNLEEVIGELNIIKSDMKVIENVYEILNNAEIRKQFHNIFIKKNAILRLPNSVFSFIDRILEKGYLSSNDYMELKEIYYDNMDERINSSISSRKKFANFISTNIFSNVKLNKNKPLIEYSDGYLIENLNQYIILTTVIKYLESNYKNDKNCIKKIKDSLEDFFNEKDDNSSNKAFIKLLREEMNR